METTKVEKPSFIKIEQAILKVMREHAEEDSQLEKDLFKVLERVQHEQIKADQVKALAYELATKLG